MFRLFNRMEFLVCFAFMQVAVWAPENSQAVQDATTQSVRVTCAWCDDQRSTMQGHCDIVLTASAMTMEQRLIEQSKCYEGVQSSYENCVDFLSYYFVGGEIYQAYPGDDSYAKLLARYCPDGYWFI